ncbi:MAG: Methyltransferase type 11 [Labilithrix sp.]|nr:Methyltransferase type 11 [Labilithrix sp.]
MTAPSLDRYYLALGAAFARGRLGDVLPASILGDDEKVFREGLARGLKMHKFKRLDDRLLARVRRVLSMLAGLAPANLLDVGSGRGAFLWPLLDAFPDLEVTAIDLDERRAADLAAIGIGGLSRLSAQQMDATALRFEDDSFDGVSLLEVLEHMPTPSLAAREAVRIARRFVVASVPSKPDDNPEHIHLFDRTTLTALFEEAGARRVTVDYVPGHMVALALVDHAPA